MSSALSWYVAVRFASLLSQPFKEWEAFRLGLIDEKGVKIRDAKTAEERQQFSSWMNIVRNLKRLLATLPGGATKFATFASAIALIRENLRGEPHGKVIAEQMIGDLLGFVHPKTRMIAERTISRHQESLGPGTYVLVDGVEFMLRSEAGLPLSFRLDTRCYAREFVLGCPVFEVIDINNRRIFVCADQVRALDQ